MPAPYPASSFVQQADTMKCIKTTLLNVLAAKCAQALGQICHVGQHRHRYCSYLLNLTRRSSIILLGRLECRLDGWYLSAL